MYFLFFWQKEKRRWTGKLNVNEDNETQIWRKALELSYLFIGTYDENIAGPWIYIQATFKEP